MNSTNTSSHWAKTGAFAAVAASLCCIAPALTLLAGIGGLASSFSWLEPARPYLIGVSVVAIGLAWYQQLKPKQVEMDCCGVPVQSGKPPFTQSKTFLGIVTVFAVLMMAFPYYMEAFTPPIERQTTAVNPADIRTAKLQIDGMTCTGCEGHVKSAVGKIPGVVEIRVSYEDGMAFVRFDETQTNLDDINAAVDETGYKIVASLVE